MKPAMILVFQFANWLWKKYKLQYATLTVRWGGITIGVTDIDFNQHFKARDLATGSREELANALAEMRLVEKDFE